MSETIKTENTAIRRNKPSRPTLYLAQNTLHLPMFSSVLDYGCGRGDDIEWLRDKHKCNVVGYDPNFILHDIEPPQDISFDAVLCNYVLCTIPDMSTRHHIVASAWHYVAPKGIMMISVRSIRSIEYARTEDWQNHKDGWITSQKRHTFQHGYTESKLLKHIYFKDMSGYRIIDKGDHLIAIIMKVKEAEC